MPKRSRERGLSFTYYKKNELLHFGAITKKEFELVGTVINEKAPKFSDSISHVYWLGERREDLDGLTLKELLEYLQIKNFKYDENGIMKVEINQKEEYQKTNLQSAEEELKNNKWPKLYKKLLNEEFDILLFDKAISYIAFPFLLKSNLSMFHKSIFIESELKIDQEIIALKLDNLQNKKIIFISSQKEEITTPAIESYCKKKDVNIINKYFL